MSNKKFKLAKSIKNGVKMPKQKRKKGLELIEQQPRTKQFQLCTCTERMREIRQYEKGSSNVLSTPEITFINRAAWATNVDRDSEQSNRS